ncbi:MAG: DNA repair protein RecO [Candidatus Omnitrophica bacterium]|nr:DNA repair protein RecO [Candidatus Omnitrophota bacterium]
MTARVEKDLGFVLRKYNLRETTIISTIYTKRFGKIKGILKGFHTQKKEFATSMDTLTLNEFLFYPKRREIWLISFADLIEGYSFIRKDLARAQSAAVFVHLLDKILPIWDSNAAVFDLIKECLYYLETEDESKVLYVFLIKLLTFSGFKPEFDRCLRCHSNLGAKIFFSASRGGLLCSNCCVAVSDVQSISREVSSTILYIQNNDFPHVLRVKPTKYCERNILYILREFIFYHLDFDITRNNYRDTMLNYRKAEARN